jgi:hypothetical protein
MVCCDPADCPENAASDKVSANIANTNEMRLRRLVMKPPSIEIDERAASAIERKSPATSLCQNDVTAMQKPR